MWQHNDLIIAKGHTLQEANTDSTIDVEINITQEN
jgi:hypothetical protein